MSEIMDAAITAALERTGGAVAEQIWVLAAERTEAGRVARKELIRAALAAAEPHLTGGAR